MRPSPFTSAVRWKAELMPSDSGATERWQRNPLVVTPGFSQFVESELADSRKCGSRQQVISEFG